MGGPNVAAQVEAMRETGPARGLVEMQGRQAGRVAEMSLAEIIAATSASLHEGREDDADEGRPPSEPTPPRSPRDEDVGPDLLQWFLHETNTLRVPVYRTEARDRREDPSGLAGDDPAQLPLIEYKYGTDDEVLVISRMGELTARDVRVMSVISQIFFEDGCPASNAIVGNTATLGYIARQLGMHPDGATGLIRASIQRLATTKVVWKKKRTVVDEQGAVQETDEAELSIGFLSDWGFRTRRTKGRPEDRRNFILLNQIMAEKIRAKAYTWLRADVVRRLKDDALATKLYMFMRTHRPDDKGVIQYGVMNLARRLGCSDTKRSRVRKKMEAAAQAVCRAAPSEFPGWHLREGRADYILVMQKRLQSPRPPLAVLPHPPVRRATGQRRPVRTDSSSSRAALQ
jgi:hypothetical protein